MGVQRFCDRPARHRALGNPGPCHRQRVPGDFGRVPGTRCLGVRPKGHLVSPPNMVTVWVATFNIPGNSVWHCHILSHEDMMMTTTSPTGLPVVSDGMMRPTHIQANMPQTQLPVVGTLSNLNKLVTVQKGF